MMPRAWEFGMNKTANNPLQLFDFEPDSVLSFLWSSLKPEYKMTGANLLSLINTPGNITEMLVQVSYKVRPASMEIIV